MVGWRAIAFALACAVISGAACARERTTARPSPPPEPERAQCEVPLHEARTFRASSEFKALAPEQQWAHVGRELTCASLLEDDKALVAACRAAREVGAPWADLTSLRAGVALRDDELAVAAFHDLAADSPVQFHNLQPRLVLGALHAARHLDATGAAELRVHESLVARGYTFSDEDVDERVRVAHARLLMPRGEIERARQRLAPVRDLRMILAIRVSKVFDPLREDAEFERRLDVRAAAEAAVERARTASAADPRKLDLVYELAGALRALGRREQALAEIDRVLALASAPRAAATFNDVSEKLNWLLDERGSLLYDLNRPAEARRAFRSAIAVGEEGAKNVSQAINFASMLEREGRPAQALAALRLVGHASPYGRMWMASVRACAAEQLRDGARLKRAMKYLREHEQDNVAALARALLCIGDLEGAAALYVRRLRDPSHQEDALLALQRYQTGGLRPTTRAQMLARRLALVRERVDVRAAVEAVGRIEAVPLLATYWGDL